ncbi:hypothetical protein BCR44DRAFT_34350 [Catenaria anguillulae PL171]|uniref:Uncharacterized protein n=1 Tax=Catenaria anguillulae PL171 TaxID=765915 RepID=A0A1Y2HKV2_9FUNG|nr:hypothetical protein BCR44DRAFT_34350 [Catenaria anguillulae PL171]
MATDPPPRWDYVRYALQDRNGNPAADVLALPANSASSTGTDTAAANRRAAPVVTRLCTLPPAGKHGQRIPPNLIDPNNGCSTPPSMSGLERVCETMPGTTSGPANLPFQASCVWRQLTDPEAVDPFDSGYCLPLDDPVLSDRGIVPVPMLSSTSKSLPVGPELGNLVIPTLKHFLESRNHSALSAFPAFANVTVRPSFRAHAPPTATACRVRACHRPRHATTSRGIARRNRPFRRHSLSTEPRLVRGTGS